MAKSKIIKELANGEITLDTAFNRLLVIASDIENEKLVKWALNELNGYDDREEVPEYRKIGLGQIIYSGINGNYQVTRQPLPSPNQTLGEDIIEILKDSFVREGISEIKSYSAIENGAARDLTELAPVVYNNTGIQCISIYMKFPKERYIKILSSINTKLLRVFLELDKEFGCLDDLDINVGEKDLKKLNDIINVIIYNDNSIKVGDNNKLKDNTIKNLGE